MLSYLAGEPLQPLDNMGKRHIAKDGAKRENQNLFKGRQPYRAPEDPFENIEEIFL